MPWMQSLAQTLLAPRSPQSNTIRGESYPVRSSLPCTAGTTDGNHYINAALEKGAQAGIITDSKPSFESLHNEIPRLLVQHGRTALAQASAAFYRHPERALMRTGVTGTNGKTTTAFLIEALLNASSRKTVLVGTIEYHVAGAIRPSAHTTPESRDLFELMAEGASLGATELVMEVSSHALDQGRVAEIGFDCRSPSPTSLEITSTTTAP